MEKGSDDHHKYSDKRPAVGVGVMIRKGNQVLLGKRKGAHGEGEYGWPGGGLEFGEKLEDAVKREALEEAGIVVNACRFICVSNIVEYGRHYIDFEFEVTDFDGEPVVNEKDFNEGWGWYDLEDLPKQMFTPCRKALVSIADNRHWNDA